MRGALWLIYVILPFNSAKTWVLHIAAWHKGYRKEVLTSNRGTASGSGIFLPIYHNTIDLIGREIGIMTLGSCQSLNKEMMLDCIMWGCVSIYSQYIGLKYKCSYMIIHPNLDWNELNTNFANVGTKISDTFKKDPLKWKNPECIYKYKLEFISENNILTHLLNLKESNQDVLIHYSKLLHISANVI